ncbi:phospholipid/cholesterol/gamma-HCH transport system substrate-binding protein [Nocardioides zeae]|uniref:Phospholipid/cholesterol/gamma-HCH transport system substrate-binding protein n=2 Tax=Nocardioides zeae TaxID=1457234 RepID=A0AAJ1X1A6_9ACTN|nr:MlaD family protein [Nocardioides zeae]MDQ1103984.1 phospholipid/cholesterol/gamma-HCH transport system substrate-binding protein [Nocardioides zeae]MDR6176324.1 phospholipid/cholesterol/gamma-HCH transport system substrate-binding protein [Nocardioides zeae]MDR6210470.1 phospholipid/cholesterol/gamma-HCH transport system substrate-binding protein [Nocardioides zeae]
MTGWKSTLVKFTIFAVISVVLFVGLFRMMTNSVGGDTATWTAQFTAVSGLREGDDVRVAGVKVGRVETIELGEGNVAEVTFSLREDQPVYEKTLLALRYQNLLGQRYLALSAPEDRGAELEPGGTIPLERTSPGFDLTVLLNGFEPLFNVLEPSEVNQLAANIVAVLQGEAGTIESLLQNTAEATQYLASKDEVFGEVLTNLTPVLENLDEQSAQFDATVDQLRDLMTGLAAQRDVFADSIDNLGDLVASTSDLLGEIRAPLASDIQSLQSTAALLAREQERVARTIESLPLLLGGYGRSMSYGAYLNVYICTLGVEVLGATAYVPSAGGPYSEGCTL